MTKSQRMLYVTRFGIAKLRILFEVEYSSSKEETCIAFCEAFDRTSDVRFKECTAVSTRSKNLKLAPVLPLLAQVEDALRHLNNASMRRQASQVVEHFRRAAAGYDLRSAPPLRANRADDGSLLIEWTFEDRRLGFNIEPNQDDSGWYFVSSKAAGGRCASGTLSILNINELMRWRSS